MLLHRWLGVCLTELLDVCGDDGRVQLVKLADVSLGAPVEDVAEQHVVGLIQQLAAAQLCGSDWLFVPIPAQLPSATELAPVLGGGTCQPGAISFAPLATDAAPENFDAVLLGDVTGNWQAAP